MHSHKFSSKLALPFAIFLVTRICHGQGQNQHQAIFYQDYNCTGSQIIVNNTVDDLTMESWASNASSIQFTGLWKYRGESTVDERLSTTVEVVHGSSPDGECLNRKQSAENHVFRFVEKVGPGADDMESNQITLCTGQNLTGLRFKTTEGRSAVPDRPIAILSWFLAGNKAWYIYSEKDFNGNRTCICPGIIASTENSSETEYGGLTFNLNSNPIVLGSVKIANSGCLECTYEPDAGHKASSHFLYILATSSFLTVMLNRM
ncbi:unnamed protein product [Orchesella dallaii]|uniref:Uncharacterized protein n=1 Tax=Orchesella dallaii TaxID=48710 RepID=A0ABP1QCF0_9HEXA